jgi:hypothetical protein
MTDITETTSEPAAPVAAPAEQPALSREEIEVVARDLRAEMNANAKPRMSEPEFAAWFQAFLTANSVLALDPRISSRDRGRIAEQQADEGLLVWRSKRMREGMPV